MTNFSIENLSVAIAHKEIIKGITLAISAGQFIGIVGPNGSGKSTLLKCLYKELKDYQGTISLLQKDLRNWRTKEVAQRNAVVAQLNETSFDFSVLEMVLMGREPHKGWWENTQPADIEIAVGKLQQVGLAAYQDRYFSDLSGGERQRVLLARALTQEAECLILDEPTNHLDVKNQIDFFNLIKQLDLTVIAVVHDLNLAANYCDQLYFLKAGHIVQSGPPEKILTPELMEEVFAVKCQIQHFGSQLQIVYQMFD